MLKENRLVKLYFKYLLMVYKLERGGTSWIKIYSLSLYLLTSAPAEQIYLCSAIVVQFSLVHVFWSWASTQLWEEPLWAWLSEALFFLSLENFSGVLSAQNHRSGDPESPTHKSHKSYYTDNITTNPDLQYTVGIILRLYCCICIAVY